MSRVILRAAGSEVWRNRRLHVIDMQYLGGKEKNRKEAWLTATSVTPAYFTLLQVFNVLLYLLLVLFSQYPCAVHIHVCCMCVITKETNGNVRLKWW